MPGTLLPPTAFAYGEFCREEVGFEGHFLFLCWNLGDRCSRKQSQAASQAGGRLGGRQCSRAPRTRDRFPQGEWLPVVEELWPAGYLFSVPKPLSHLFTRGGKELGSASLPRPSLPSLSLAG